MGTVEDGIAQLSKRTSKLERLLGKLGTSQDNADVRNQLSKERKAAKALCKTTMEQLRTARGNTAKQQLYRLTQTFEQELGRYTKVQQQIEKKERSIVSTMSTRGDSAISAATAESGNFSQSAQIQFLEYDHEEIQRRQEGIRAIERDVVEVSEMFKDLQLLVDEQQETLNVIDNNIVETKVKTEQAHAELVEAAEYQMRARKKKCCLVMIIIIALAAIITFIYVTTK